ncbi:hypothetical protein [Blastococcus brunescens]|uniref:Uncharacterized protein n=1 Tax=Blastococcus brunescens TaxID=1564165 RepID=A0ABZ1AYH5_9ACTN|nr:hypothetical protein [Blastococcus sp. BMG 8361]WRL61855.1 hypothetical protein U6N30_17210 [Blastococcus sp. BMG 8361]
MTTSPDTQTSAPRRPQGWRLALFASGAALLAGGPMHPDPTPRARCARNWR